MLPCTAAGELGRLQKVCCQYLHLMNLFQLLLRLLHLLPAKHLFLLWLMCASKWEVFLALKLAVVVSPRLPPGKEQKQCCALCWAGSDEKHGATPDPTLAVGGCTVAVPAPSSGAARPCPICGLGASSTPAWHGLSACSQSRGEIGVIQLLCCLPGRPLSKAHCCWECPQEEGLD